MYVRSYNVSSKSAERKKERKMDLIIDFFVLRYICVNIFQPEPIESGVEGH